jgi:broad specificity phosphatase PhoE
LSSGKRFEMRATTSPRQSHLGLEQLLSTARSMPLNPKVDHFWFLRHGQTEGNRQKFFQPAIQPLNERGILQARQAANAMRESRIARIIASDMTRTLQTAAAIAETCQLEVTPSPLLRERNFGELVGSSSWVIDWTCNPKGGESLEAFVLRVRQGIDESLSENQTLLVAHGGTLYVLASVLGVDVAEASLANATPLGFYRQAGSWRIETLQPTGNEEATLS